jgi:hypothetical protein
MMVQAIKRSNVNKYILLVVAMLAAAHGFDQQTVFCGWFR